MTAQERRKRIMSLIMDGVNDRIDFISVEDSTMRIHYVNGDKPVNWMKFDSASEASALANSVELILEFIKG